MSFREFVDKNENYLVALTKKLIDIDTSVPPGETTLKFSK